MKKVLICGESWVTYSTHIKGFDTFYTCTYSGGIEWIKKALEAGGYAVEHMPCHVVAEHFPYTAEDMAQYDCIVFSDVGANTLLMPAPTFISSLRAPNRLDALETYVKNGGGFCMIGGYMSFGGIEGKGKYAGTAVERILPVEIGNFDDRVEAPQGIVPTTVKSPVFDGITGEWPFFLGYNKLTPKKDAKVIAKIDGDPFIALHEVKKGRTAIFASDCAPHWGPPEFVNWPHYGKLWCNLAAWLTKEIK